MNSIPHDFVTVGLKAALVERARLRRVAVSVIVRDAVACALAAEAPTATFTNPVGP